MASIPLSTPAPNLLPPKPAGDGSEQSPNFLATTHITHQIRSAAAIVFRDAPGVDKHALEAGDPLLWVGVMAATITEQRARIAHLEEILDRYLPAAPVPRPGEMVPA